MNMKSNLALPLLASAILAPSMGSQLNEAMKTKEPPNGNHLRSHEENVKRKRLRRITKKSKQINRR